MHQLSSLWSALDTRRRVIVGLATLAMFAAVLFIARSATTPDMSLLYASLDDGAAGEVVNALDQRGVAYEVRGSSIYVDAGRRDSLRMTLASEGMPASGGAGYELLDSLSGFGTTSQMFDAAYWRAKEGELARTITAGSYFKSARVHIAKTDGRPFRGEVAPSASVTVTTRGGTVDAGRVDALRHLVAAAVAGLAPGDVAVIDGAGRLVSDADGTSGTAPGATDRAAELKRRVERLLEARVGEGNAVVEVSVETETQRESVVERRVDPESRVAISTDTRETSSSSTETQEDVTVASNVPAGEAEAGGESSSQSNETEQRTNFEVSETQREIVREPGALKRLSVAVLVDGLREVGEGGEATWSPRPAEEMEALQGLVASAVGYDESRGDVITIESMRFEPTQPGGTLVESSFFNLSDLNALSVLQLVVFALVALVLGLFVIRPMFALRGHDAALPEPAPERAEALTGEISEAGSDKAGAQHHEAGSAAHDGTADAASSFLPAPAAQSEAVARLRALIEQRQDETVEILRTWMEDGERET